MNMKMKMNTKMNMNMRPHKLLGPLGPEIKGENVPESNGEKMSESDVVLYFWGVHRSA